MLGRKPANSAAAAICVSLLLWPGRVSVAHELSHSYALRTSGQLALDLGRYDRAIANFQAAYEMDRDPTLLYLLARAYRLAHKPEQALQSCSALLQATSRSGASSVLLSNLASELEAIALQLQPEPQPVAPHGNFPGQAAARQESYSVEARPPVATVEARTAPKPAQDASGAVRSDLRAEAFQPGTLGKTAARSAISVALPVASLAKGPVAQANQPAGPDPMAIVRDRENSAALRACCDRMTKRDGSLADGKLTGKLNVTATIGASGAVQTVSVEAPQTLEAVSACVRNVVRHWHFPSKGEESQLSFPLIVHPGG
jgi:hypothetical protein